jgi:mono/diheme cytochrome c family protein
MRVLTTFGAVVALVLLFTAGRAPSAESVARTSALIERGRSLVAFGSCNDCHTAGWRETDGQIPVSEWMTGQAVGFRGPWGTIYPINVRLWFQEIGEDEWLKDIATRAGHPPMKWTDLRTLSIDDRRAIYRFIRSLGPAGKPAPLDVPPGREPTTPYIDIMPHR